MTETNALVDQIVTALQDKKGHDVTIADLTHIDDTICQYFILCTGNSPSHVQALAQNVGEEILKKLGQHPVGVAGMRNSIWVAMDYADVMVHIFLPDEREFYDLEHLWADAELVTLEDIL